MFGNDTINRSTTVCSLHFTGSSARNILQDCDFIGMADNSGAVHIEIDSTGIDRFLMLKGNTLMMNFGTTLTQAIDSNLSDATNRKIVVNGTLTVVGAADVSDNPTHIEFTRMTETQNVLGLSIQHT